jgi:hypothetical protein
MGQMDEFYKGAELGLRVSDQRARHTNLAERAAQTNRQLDISERQADANMSRLNLLNKQLDYDYTQQKNDDNETTLQLNALKDYKEQLADAANTEGFTKLPQPPAGLHGTYQQDAFRAHQGYLSSRQNDRDYLRHVKDVDDKNDLIDNYGLAADWQSREPLARDMSLESAQKNRALKTASKIAYEMGVREADVQGIRLEQFFNPDTGKLDETSFRSAIQPFSSYVVTGKTAHSTGTTSTTSTSKSAIAAKKTTANVQRVRDERSKLDAAITKRRQALVDDQGLEPSEVNSRIQSEYPPDSVFNGVSYYKGEELTDRQGNTLIFIGGDAELKSNWIKVR